MQISIFIHIKWEGISGQRLFWICFGGAVLNSLKWAEAFCLFSTTFNTCFWGCFQVIWSTVVRPFLLFNIHLTVSFEGKYICVCIYYLETRLAFLVENKGTEAVRALVPPGKDPPPPLGDHMLLGEAVDDAAKRSERLTTSSISMLIFCCSTMLTSSYPVRVMTGVLK